MNQRTRPWISLMGVVLFLSLPKSQQALAQGVVEFSSGTYAVSEQTTIGMIPRQSALAYDTWHSSDRHVFLQSVKRDLFGDPFRLTQEQEDKARLEAARRLNEQQLQANIRHDENFKREREARRKVDEIRERADYVETGRFGLLPTGLTVIGEPSLRAEIVDADARKMFGFQTQTFDIEGSVPKNNIVMMDGGIAALEVFWREIAKIPSGAITPVTLAVGQELRSSETGTRASVSILKFLALNPDVATQLEKNGFRLMAFDARTGEHFKNLNEFYKSETWKKLNRQIAEAAKTIESGELKKKLMAIERNEKKLQTLTGKEKSELKSQVADQRAEVQRIQGLAYAKDLSANSILELAKTQPDSKVSDILVTAVNKSIAAEVGVRDAKTGGTKVDAKAAAKRARTVK